MNNKLALLINNNYNNNYIKMIVLGHNSFTRAVLVIWPKSPDFFLYLLHAFLNEFGESTKLGLVYTPL